MSDEFGQDLETGDHDPEGHFGHGPGACHVAVVGAVRGLAGDDGVGKSDDGGDAGAVRC